MNDPAGNEARPLDESEAIRRAMADFDKNTTFPDRPEYLELQRAQKKSWARTLLIEAQRLNREADEPPPDMKAPE